jgi:hypothetical protein
VSSNDEYEESMTEPAEGGSYNTFLDSLNRFSRSGASAEEAISVDAAQALYEVAQGLDRARFNIRNSERTLRALSHYIAELEDVDLRDRVRKAVEELEYLAEDQGYILERAWDSLGELILQGGPVEGGDRTLTRLQDLFLRSRRSYRPAETFETRPPKS